jgi:outer membrane autotransporter protein
MAARAASRPGTDLFADSNWRAGVHVGQLDGNMHVSGFASGIYNKQVGSNDLRSRFLGGYATWRNDGGFYADAVLQAGQHRYTAQPLGGASTRGKGSSVLASLEVVQAFALAEGWQIEPQLQLVHQRMSLDDASIAGARVQQDSDKGWLVRAGVRVKGEVATGAGRLQPYGRLNLYRASSGTDVTRFASPAAATGIASSTGGTAAELAGGFTLALGESTSLYGELGKQWASGGQTRVRSSVQGSLGLRIKW